MSDGAHINTFDTVPYSVGKQLVHLTVPQQLVHLTLGKFMFSGNVYQVLEGVIFLSFFARKFEKVEEQRRVALVEARPQKAKMRQTPAAEDVPPSLAT